MPPSQGVALQAHIRHGYRCFSWDCRPPHLHRTLILVPKSLTLNTFVYPDDRGFGGKCLPKDTTAIIAACEQQGFTPPPLKAVMAVNAAYRQHDVAYRPFLSAKGTPRSATVQEGPGNRPGVANLSFAHSTSPPSPSDKRPQGWKQPTPRRTAKSRPTMTRPPVCPRWSASRSSTTTI